MAKRQAARAEPKKKRRRRAKVSPPTLNMPAGTLRTAPDASPSSVHVFGYGADDFVERRVFDEAEVRAFLERWSVTWVHVVGLGDGQLIERIGKLFGLHKLALEDVFHTAQRPKVDHFGPVTQVIARMVEGQDSSETEQLSIFVAAGFVVSFEERPGDIFEAVRQRIRTELGRVRGSGPDFLVYSLLDMLIDAYFPVLERLSAELDGIEDGMYDRKAMDQIPRLRTVKRELLGIGRALWPVREVVTALLSGECKLVREETRTYLRDCHDHCAQLLDLVSTYRELASDLSDLQVSLSGQRLNEVMKVLTVMSSLFIPLTFICSIYGMNFDPAVSRFNMPELRWIYGYPFALGLMAATAGFLLLFFRRKGWI